MKKIVHHRIIGFRNIIIHDYDSIDPELVWAAITPLERNAWNLSLTLFLKL